MRKWVCLLLGILLGLSCSREELRNQREAQTFIDSLANVLMPLQIQTMQLFWEATSTGSDSLFAEYARSENRLMNIYNDRPAFVKVRKLAAKKVKDPILAREIQVVYNEFLSNQADSLNQKRLSETFGELYQIFQNYVYDMNGQKVPVEQLRTIMRESNDSKEREMAWKTLKQIGSEIEEPFLNVVNQLNESARALGFENFYEQKLMTQEEVPQMIEEIIRQYAEGTSGLYRQIKTKIDSALAARYQIGPDELMIWHYPDPYAAEAPFGKSQTIDKFYKEKDVIEIARRFYTGIGFDVEDILRKSDLTARPEKYRQAYCIDVNRMGDVRIMANITNDARGLGILMHEMGHAVHFMNLNRDLPYYLLDLPIPGFLPRREIHFNKELPFLLRDNTHFFIAEGMANFFQELTTDPNWMTQILGLTPEESAEYLQQVREIHPARELYLSGWMLVMFYFEKALYENPDQDLNKLWWDLIEKYQLIKRPPERDEPDWACNYHLVILPLYYQNYLLGDVFAAQLAYAIARDQGLDSPDKINYIDNEKIGDFLKSKVLSVGKRYRWDELIRKATGEDLTVKYYIEKLSY